MRQSEREQIRRAVGLIHSGSDYETGMKILCVFAKIERPELAIRDRPQVLGGNAATATKFATRGKPCLCSHGIGAHRSSAGAMETFCRREHCYCSGYRRDTESQSLTAPPPRH